MEYVIKDAVHWQKLVRFISLRFQHGDAEDLLQTAYLKFYEKHHRNSVRNGDAFLVTTAIHAGIDEARRRKHFDTSGGQSVDALSDPVPDQEEVFSSRQRLILVRKILADMKPRTRNILLMHRLDGLTYREIAAQMDISQSAVEKQMAKGMRTLMAAVEEV